jgi:hypothetical protein
VQEECPAAFRSTPLPKVQCVVHACPPKTLLSCTPARWQALLCMHGVHWSRLASVLVLTCAAVGDSLVLSVKDIVARSGLHSMFWQMRSEHTLRATGCRSQPHSHANHHMITLQSNRQVHTAMCCDPGHPMGHNNHTAVAVRPTTSTVPVYARYTAQMPQAPFTNCGSHPVLNAGRQSEHNTTPSWGAVELQLVATERST